MKDMQIWEFTAVDAVAAMRKGTLTCATYVEHLLDRVRSTADLLCGGQTRAAAWRADGGKRQYRCSRVASCRWYTGAGEQPAEMPCRDRRTIDRRRRHRHGENQHA